MIWKDAELETEQVFASAFANNPQKFYIRIGIRIRGCCNASETYQGLLQIYNPLCSAVSNLY